MNPAKIQPSEMHAAEQRRLLAK
jgi:hypothetical protein